MADTVRIRLGVAGVLMLAGALFAQEEPAGWLGVFMQNVNESIAAQQGLKSPAGVLVQDIIKESPAEKGGLLKNDIILKLDGKAIDDTARLKKMILQRADKTVQVEILRAAQPLSLPIVIGEKKKNEEWLTVTAFNEESSGDNAEKEGHLRPALDNYLKALTQMKSPGVDFRLRQKIIAIVLRLEVPPATPEQAERAMTIARAAQAEATDESGYDKSLQHYAEALRYAPWLPDLYFNLGVLYDRKGWFNDALRSFRLYLLAAPGAEDAQKVKERIYLLEDKLKEQQAAHAAKSKVRQAAEDRKNKEKAMRRTMLSLCFGMNSQETSTCTWGKRSTFSCVFKGITWAPGLHLGIEVAPATMYFTPKGSSFMVGCGTIGLIFEKSHSSPGTGTMATYDSSTRITTTGSLPLTEKSFTLAKFILSDEITMGYRIQLNKVFAVEPYGGIALAFHMLFLGGTAVNDTTMTNDGGFRIGFPLGTRVYWRRFFLEYEYQNVTKWWGTGKLTYYNAKTSKTEYNASLPMDGASYWAIKAGIVF